MPWELSGLHIGAVLSLRSSATVFGRWLHLATFLRGEPSRFRRLGFVKLLTWQNIFCTLTRILRSDPGIVVQDHVQQGIMDFQLSVVFDKTQFAEFVHEKAYARSSRADHLRQRFMTELSHDRLRPAFLAEICKEKEKPRKALFARIK
jgi:hypothetical protein